MRTPCESDMGERFRVTSSLRVDMSERFRVTSSKLASANQQVVKRWLPMLL